jgi:hypothetical protein
MSGESLEGLLELAQLFVSQVYPKYCLFIRFDVN